MIILTVNTWLFNILIYTFIAGFTAMIIFILLYLQVKSVHERRKEKWRPIVSLFIQKIIFLEASEVINIPSVFNKLLQKKAFRRNLATELRKIKASLNGDAADNLTGLYKTLQLERDLLPKLKSSKWHLKVQSIKELAAMGQQEHTKKIFRLTNHHNELLRIEAQCALVELYGFFGLRFLNVTTHPLSEWQQVLLLHKLTQNKSNKNIIISKWLDSSNQSVVIFTLKLVSHYKCYELHNSVVDLLDHVSEQVRIEAVKCLRQIFMEETAEHLLNHQNPGNKQYELLLLESLQGYTPEIETGYLLQQLGHADDDIKFAAAKMLSENIPGGKNMLHNYHSADISPWKQIITQLKNEKAA